MDWDRIKTIFIVTFLFWTFSHFQFIQKQDSNQLELIAETKDRSKLKANKITMGNFPKRTEKKSFIRAENKTFKERRRTVFKNQTAHIQNMYKIESKLKEPF